MGSWVVAALMSAVMSPEALAERQEIECQFDEARRAAPQRAERDATPAPVAPVVSQRDESEAPARPALGERRRSGKPVPDAELIGRRRVL